MVNPITSRQLAILQLLAKHPGVDRELLARTTLAAPGDMAYLMDNDLMRERTGGHCHISHFGELVLKRS